jgi:hypothetical protein
VLYNPAENSTAAAQGVTRTLNVTGEIQILKPDRVLGLSTIEADVLAINEKGVELAGPSGMSSWRYYSPLTIRRINPNTEYVGISFSMDPNLGYPLMLETLGWTSYALLFQKKQSIDLPFQVTGQSVQILPGVKVLIEEATSQGEDYRYQLKTEFEGTVNPFAMMVSMHEGSILPGYLISEIQLLDAQGSPVNASSGSFGSSMSGSTGKATLTGHGTCSACGGVKTIRFVVVVNPYEVKIPFVLTDIPVPTF